jgi:FHA domain-containing protein
MTVITRPLGATTATAKRTAALVALTEQAQAALGGRTEVRINRFPFKVGRESRMSSFAKLKSELERRLQRSAQLNDLYLLESPSAGPLHISREHFVIERFENGYIVIDRGSACGTIAGGRQLGANASIDHTDLHAGDLIVVGSSASPYVFRFELP